MHCVLLNCTSSIHSTKEALAHHYAMALEKYSKCDNLALEKGSDKTLLSFVTQKLHSSYGFFQDWPYFFFMKIRPSKNF